MKTNSPSFFFSDRFLVILLWLFFQTIWAFWFGPHFDLEAVKYIGEAQYIAEHHQLSQFRYLFYFTTIAVIAFANAVHLGSYGALVIIMLINLWSYLLFFKALKKFFANKLSPFLVVGLLMSFWPYQSWSMFLFTECLFYSLVVVLFSYLLLYQKLSLRFVTVTALLLFLLIISRPLGILFVPPTLLFIFFKLSKRQRLYVAVAGILFLVLLNYIMQIVFTTTPDWNMTRALTEDSIICDIPRSGGGAGLDLSDSPNQFYQLFYYVTHNLSHFAGLALIRLKYFFGMVRDYYSSFHNLFIVAYLLVIYGSIVFGIKRILREVTLSLNVFIFSAIIIFACTIALQCDDYHNRFFLTLMPFFALFTVKAWDSYLRNRSSLKRHIH